jgi:hypothetical protein
VFENQGLLGDNLCMRTKRSFQYLGLVLLVVASFSCGNFRLQKPPIDNNTSTSVAGAYGPETNCNGTASVAGVNRLMTIVVGRANPAGVDTTVSPLYQAYVLYDGTTPEAPSIGMKADQDAVTYPKHYTPTVTLGTPQNDGTLTDISVSGASIGTIQFWSSGSVQTITLLCHLAGT